MCVTRGVDVKCKRWTNAPVNFDEKNYGRLVLSYILKNGRWSHIPVSRFLLFVHLSWTFSSFARFVGLFPMIFSEIIGKIDMFNVSSHVHTSVTLERFEKNYYWKKRIVREQSYIFCWSEIDFLKNVKFSPIFPYYLFLIGTQVLYIISSRLILSKKLFFIK